MVLQGVATHIGKALFRQIPAHTSQNILLLPLRAIHRFLCESIIFLYEKKREMETPEIARWSNVAQRPFATCRCIYIFLLIRYLHLAVMFYSALYYTPLHEANVLKFPSIFLIYYLYKFFYYYHLFHF